MCAKDADNMTASPPQLTQNVNESTAATPCEATTQTPQLEYCDCEERMSVLRQKVTCPVCLDIPRRCGLVTCPNGHLLCETCYDRLRISERTGRKSCPTCRSRFGMSFEGSEGLYGLPPRSSVAQAILDVVRIKCR